MSNQDSGKDITLTPKDAEALADLMENPPAPNDALKRAVNRYKETVTVPAMTNQDREEMLKLAERLREVHVGEPGLLAKDDETICKAADFLEGIARSPASAELASLGDVVKVSDFASGEGDWIELHNGKHGAAALVVWRMDGDERSPECEAFAKRIVEALNVQQAGPAPTLSAEPAARVSKHGLHDITGGRLQLGAALYLHPDPKVAELEAELSAAKDKLEGLTELRRVMEAELAEARRVTFDPAVLDQMNALEAELERERMRLAACGTAALGYFKGCADEYKSASLDDVLRLVAENAALRNDAKRYSYLKRHKGFNDFAICLWNEDQFEWMDVSAMEYEKLDAAIDAAIAKESRHG